METELLRTNTDLNADILLALRAKAQAAKLWAPTLKHPPEHVHVVGRGDTLYSIARLYETSVAEIILANPGDEPIKLYRGTELVIPNPGSGFAGQGAIPLDATRES